MINSTRLTFCDRSTRRKYLLTLWGLVYLFCTFLCRLPPWRGVDVPFPIPPKLLFLSQQNWFWVFDSAGHREPFRLTLLGYPPHTPRSYHHTGRGCNPTVRECYFLLFSSRLRVRNFTSLSSSRPRSEQLSTAIEKVLDLTMLKKISITIGEKISITIGEKFSNTIK